MICTFGVAEVLNCTFRHCKLLRLGLKKLMIFALKSKRIDWKDGSVGAEVVAQKRQSHWFLCGGVLITLITHTEINWIGLGCIKRALSRDLFELFSSLALHVTSERNGMVNLWYQKLWIF